MKIKVKTSASIRNVLGFDEKALIVSDGITVYNVIRELCRNRRDCDKIRNSARFAINENYCLNDAILSNDDILAIFPPVGG